MKVLLVEDELELATEIERYLLGHEIVCELVGEINQAREKISNYEYDCIVLDLMLPDGTGMELLKELRQQKRQEGIIIISAREHLEGKVEALRSGADDYITKPFHLSELLARIQSLVRRRYFNGNNILKFHEIEIDLNTKSLEANGQKIILTKKEYQLLLYLMGNHNRVLSKSAIAEHLSGDQADLLINHDFVYAHIKNLKRKLTASGCNDYIKTVYGIGYKWQ